MRYMGDDVCNFGVPYWTMSILMAKASSDT